MNVFGRLRGYIYTELLLKIYYPRFLRSTQVRDVLILLWVCASVNEDHLLKEGRKRRGRREREGGER